jgi:PAS domain S-box-containing protein
MTHLSSFRNRRSLFIILVLAIAGAGLFFAWWTARRTDGEMRTDLLQQTQMTTQAMDVNHVKALSGTETDLGKPEYRRLSEQARAVCSVKTGWRWIYLMGYRSDGTVFFYLDSESTSSKDHAFPGQVYDEAPESFRRVFETGRAIVEGPYTDHWGKWVSALVPITDPQTGVVLAVLGTDIDARDWKWNMASRTALPVGLMLILLIVAVAVFSVHRRINTAPKPILQRLLPPIATILVLLMAGVGALLWQQHRQGIDREIASDISDVYGEMHMAIDQEYSILGALAQPVAANPSVQKALRERDADRLLADWQPVFETLRQERHLSHFYFLDANRICLMRIHNPKQHGELVNHSMILDAKRTGEVSSGIELGSRGNLALRTVQPVFEGGMLVGYVELGKEIGDVLQTLHLRSAIQLAVLIRKEFLDRQAWEDGMRLLGHQPDWDRLPRSVVIYSSQKRLPDTLVSLGDQTAGEHAQGKTNRKTDDGKDWIVSSMPLRDSLGKEIGDLLIMRNISAENSVFTYLFILGGTVCAVLLTLMLCFLYVLLRRTDSGIRAQQEELRKSEAQKNGILNGISTNIALLDKELKILWANRAAAKSVNKQPEDMVGHTCYSFWGNSTEPCENCPAFKAIQTGKPEHKVVHTPDGRIWDEEAEPLFDTSGNVTAVIEIAQDITEQQQAEATLRDSEKRFSSLVAQSPLSIQILDVSGKTVQVNRAFEDLWGISFGQMRDYNILKDEQFRDIGLVSYLEKAFSGNLSDFPPAEFTPRLGALVGHKRIVQAFAYPIKDESGAVKEVTLMHRDITKQRTAELHRDKQLLFARALNEIAEVVISKDNAKDILENANRIVGESMQVDRTLIYHVSFKENQITGLCEWLGQNHPDIAPTKDRYPLDMFLSPFTEIRNTLKYLESHFNEVNEHFMKDGSGEILHSQLKIKSLIWYPFFFDEHGYHVFTLNQILEQRRWTQDEIDFLESVAKQISLALIKIKLLEEKKFAEEERIRLESNLRESQKMEAVGQLAGGISHDFNNLLSVISGYSQILLMNPDLSGKARLQIEAIDQAGERAAGLTRQLLMFSRRQPVAPKIINLDMIVSGIEKMLRRLIKEDVTVTRNIEPVLWLIKADPGSIEQVIMNLFINASDAMPDGGTLTVEIANVKIDETNLHYHHSDIKPGLYVMLSVSDTGCGMDKNVKEHIFEPFFTTKEIGKGTGLGLATVYSIIKQSNALIDVQSEPGKGTRFRIYFPKALDDGIANEGQHETENMPRGTETILLAEDEDSMRNMLQNFLQSIGYTVLPACNGKNALEIAKNHKEPIHVLLTDVVMPEMNGFDLAKHVKNSFPEMKLLFMSGHAKPTDTHKMMKIGDNLIEKPVSIYALAVKLRKILG